MFKLIVYLYVPVSLTRNETQIKLLVHIHPIFISVSVGAYSQTAVIAKNFEFIIIILN